MLQRSQCNSYGMSRTHEELPARPAYDSATAALLERIEPLGVFGTMTVQKIPSWRVPADEVRAGFLLKHPDIDLEDVDVLRQDGTTLPAAVARSAQGACVGRPGPLFLSLHGGGLVMGCRFNGLSTVVPWLRRYGGVIVSPEYRLAPEDPAPAGVEDCYATLCWAVEHAEDLGADPRRVVVVGPSAGGGLSAGTLLMARDRQGPAVLGGLLDYPMLDDRSGMQHWQDSVSARQYPDDGTWPAAYNNVAWDAALGERRGTARSWSPHTRPPPALHGWADCRRCSSQWPPPRSSGMRMSPSPPGCGATAVMPSCTSTPGALTPWSSSMRGGSRRGSLPRATCGWRGCFVRRTRVSMFWPWRRPEPIRL